MHIKVFVTLPPTHLYMKVDDEKLESIVTFNAPFRIKKNLGCARFADLFANSCAP